MNYQTMKRHGRNLDAYYWATQTPQIHLYINSKFLCFCQPILCTCLHSNDIDYLRNEMKWKRNKRNDLCFNESKKDTTQRRYQGGECDPSGGSCFTGKTLYYAGFVPGPFAHLASSEAVLRAILRLSSLYVFPFFFF